MSERPILMSAPMVRAILSGAKTQTRRPIRPVGRDEGFCITELEAGPWPFRSDDGESGFHTVRERGKEYLREAAIDCPFGKTGDRLWVRETWQPDPPIDDTWASTQWHGCPRDSKVSEIPEWYRSARHCLYKADQTHDLIGWRPSIHMPRWASRITLEVTGVRVERLQDISMADARAEGAPPSHRSIDAVSRQFGYEDFPRSWFAQIWESINGPDAWAANPWVWAVSFRRIAL